MTFPFHLRRDIMKGFFYFLFGFSVNSDLITPHFGALFTQICNYFGLLHKTPFFEVILLKMR